MSFLEKLNWRFATKSFDSEKKISNSDLEKIKESIRLAPSSYGLQPYRIIVVSNQELKDRLKSASFNQNQVSDCSHLFVFISKTDLQTRIGEYCDLIKDSSGLFDGIKFEAGARTFFGIKGMNDEKKLRIASNQTYIALGFALAACAELQIDSCPMEGFMPSEYKDILAKENIKLNEDEVVSVVLATGYRKEDPKFKKARFTEEQLFQSV